MLFRSNFLREACVPDPERPAESRPGSNQEPAFLWLRRGDQLFLGVTLCALTVLLGVHAFRINGWAFRPDPAKVLTADGYVYTLDINNATWVEWAQLDGIGETLARRIVEDREERGPFDSIDDVSRVRGIGPKTMERIRPNLRSSQRETADQSRVDGFELIP
jgi:competence protein ComEA